MGQFSGSFVSKQGKWAQLDAERYFADPEEIFALDQVVTEEVPVPEWTPEPARSRGEYRMIIVRGMDAGERKAFSAKSVDYSKPLTDPNRWENAWSREESDFELVRVCAVRPDGQPLFTYEQARRLKDVAAKPFARLLSACRRVNGMDSDDLRDSVKNAVGGTPSGVSPTGSPLPLANAIPGDSFTEMER